MADALKNIFNRALIVQMADNIQKIHGAFDRKQFIDRAENGLEALALASRAYHIKDAIKYTLAKSYPETLKILLQSMGPKLSLSTQFGPNVFYYWPYAAYVATEGLEHFEASMQANYEITQRFTAEWSMRPFIEKYPDRTFDQLKKWVNDPNEHVRRLVSECTRPRLPWAVQVPYLRENPERIIALIALLRDDPSLYVRRSVANNLNDLSRDFPDKVLETCEHWVKNASPNRLALIRHALRSLIRKRHKRALKIMGAVAPRKLHVHGTISPKKLSIGEKVRLSVGFHNGSSKSQKLIITFGIDFIKANGQSRRKIFNGATITLAPKQKKQFTKTISLKQHTTRKHYPGAHKVHLIVNGFCKFLGHFELTKGV